MPAVVAAGPKNRGPSDRGNREETTSRMGAMASPIVAAAPAAAEIDDAPIPLNLERGRAEQRRALKEARDEFQTGEEKG